MYRILFEDSPVPILLLDTELNILEANQRACEITGYSKGKLLSLSSHHIFSPMLLKKLYGIVKTPKNKKPPREKFEILTKDGVWHPFTTEVRMVDSPERAFVRLALFEPSGNEIYKDERDQLIEELKRKKKELNGLTEITANAISTLHLDELLDVLLARIVAVTEADAALILLKENDLLRARASFGLEEAGTMKYTIQIGEGFAGTIAARMEPLYIRDAQTDSRVSNLQIKQHGIRSMVGVPLKRNGTFLGVLHVDWLSIHPYDEREIRLLEITAERCTMAILNAQMYEETKELHDYLKMQIDRMPLGCIVWDADWKVKSWNPAAEKIFGFTAEEAIGKHANDLIVPEEVRPHVDEIWRRLLNGDMTAYSENENTAKDGRTITCQWTNTPLIKPDGTVHGVLSMVQDITEKKMMEAQFHRAQRMESIGILAGGIAHDLNNIFQPITMSLHLLRSNLSDERSKRFIDIVENSAERGANLVRQILSFTRGPEGEPTLLQLKHVLAELQGLLEETLPKSIRIKTDLPKDLWNNMGDPTKLHQVFMNLCVNARDAMPDGGVLNIKAGNIFIDENFSRMYKDVKVGPYILITVSDNGVGIPAADLERIFEPFYTTKELSQGTGLGLSTSLNIVNDHDGFILVESEPGKGAEFKVYLPAVDTTKNNVPEPMQADEIPKGRGETVLFVDDEASIREITKLTLEANGYKVITANDGTEAVAIYLQNKNEIEVGIIDYMMPVMNGHATAKAIRNISPDIKIILASGFKEGTHVSADDEEHIAFILSKPYTSETLLKTLYEILYNKDL